jgi:gamma-glutamyltranspeptidase
VQPAGTGVRRTSAQTLQLLAEQGADAFYEDSP